MARRAEAVGSYGISYSFGKLRAVLDSFASLSDGRPTEPGVERRAIRLARELGATAVPLLIRKLHATDESEAGWACTLLAALGGERAIADARKGIALALLSELGVETPDDVSLKDPRALREGSVRELLDTLSDAADVARATDLLLEQVSAEALPAFMADIVDVAADEATPLLDELLARDDVSPAAR